MVHSMQARHSVATGGGNRTNRKLTRVVFSVIGRDFRVFKIRQKIEIKYCKTIQTVFWTLGLVSYTGIEKCGFDVWIKLIVKIKNFEQIRKKKSKKIFAWKNQKFFVGTTKFSWETSFDAAPRWWYPGVLEIQVNLWNWQIAKTPSNTDILYCIKY